MTHVSVYIPCYNQAHCVAEAIQSVLDQTRPADEIVIVDDASTDESATIIRDFASRYPDAIVPVFHEANQGISRTRNDALERATGDFVTHVDGDDRMGPRKLEVEAAVLEEDPECGFVFSNYRVVTGEGALVWPWVEASRPAEGHILGETFCRDFPKQVLFRMEMVRRDAYREVGFYDPHFTVYEDFEQKIRLSAALRCRYVHEVTGEYVVHGEGLSKQDARIRFDALRRIRRLHEGKLAVLEPSVRRRVLSMFHAWVAHEAVNALEASLSAGDEGWLPRRWRQAGYLAYCRRHNPSLLTRDLVRKALLA